MGAIRKEPTLSNVDIRILFPDRVRSFYSTDVRFAAEGLSGLAQPIRTQRRAVRNKAAMGAQMAVDGQSVNLIDYSNSGAQLSGTLRMRPHQQIRIVPAGSADAIVGKVVWSEMFGSARRPKYRWGVQFGSQVPLPQLLR